MQKLQATRTNFNGLVGYIKYNDMPVGLDVIRINKVNKKAVVGFYGSDFVYSVDVVVAKNELVGFWFFESYYQLEDLNVLDNGIENWY
jgi:hypothetical protein